VLSVFHGLANRLRAVAGGVALARELNRELHLDWKVNDQCLASWHDLFAAPLLLAGTPTLLTLKGDRGAWSCYSARGGGGSALDRIDLAGLAADATEVVHLSCCKCVSSLLESASIASDEASRRLFYQTMVPSAAVAALMAPVIASAEGNYLVGVHIRQGDAYDTEKSYFFRDRTGLYQAGAGTARGGGLVEKFLEKMAVFPATKGRDGQLPACFFLAADQLDARRRCVERFGAHRILEVVPTRPQEEMTRRDSVEDMETAAAEWLLLSLCKRMIRSQVSSFSAEASRRWIPTGCGRVVSISRLP
jgi:hypothetical protein